MQHAAAETGPPHAEVGAHRLCCCCPATGARALLPLAAVCAGARAAASLLLFSGRSGSRCLQPWAEAAAV